MELNKEIIIDMYVNQKMSLRMIADEFKTNHHMIKRILIRNNITIDNKNRKQKPFSEEYRNILSERMKNIRKNNPNCGVTKHTIETKYKNMINHIKYDVDINFYMQFEDIEKIKILNKMLFRERDYKYFDTNTYKLFIEKFYYDKQFNKVYEIWINSNKDKWAKPSLDHIIPLSRGGNYDLDNLQILTWFENKTKFNMTQSEWNKFKIDTQTTSIYFI